MGIFDKFKKKPTDYAEEIIAKLGCDCTVLEGKSAQNVMKVYKDSLAQGKKDGFSPLIIIPSGMMLDVVDGVICEDDRETILEKAKGVNVESLLKQRLEEVMPTEEDEDFDITGEFSLSEQPNHFLSLEDLDGQRVIIAKIPTDKPWEAAAWLPMGGFNDCPFPEEQVAVFNYWYEKFGAVPALVTSEIWECYVENPPKTQEAAEALAWEQFAFCSDIVWQGVGTVNELAGTLLDSNVWYFWWD